MVLKMATYRVITLQVPTPFGNQILPTLQDFEKMVSDEVQYKNAKLVGGVSVTILHPDSGMPTFVYSQAVTYKYPMD